MFIGTQHVPRLPCAIANVTNVENAADSRIRTLKEAKKSGGGTPLNQEITLLMPKHIEFLLQRVGLPIKSFPLTRLPSLQTGPPQPQQHKRHQPGAGTRETLVSRTGTERGELFYREWKGYYLGRVPNISIRGQFWRRHWLPHHLKSTYFVLSFSLNKVSLRGTGYPKTYYVARVACLSPPTASWYYRRMLPGPAQKPLCNQNTKQNKQKNYEESKSILENIFAISVIKGDTNHRTIAVFLWCFCLFVRCFVF